MTPELAATLAQLSADINRQVGLLIDRRGHIAHVVVGDATRIVLPDLGRHRAGAGRLRGVRLVHTHLDARGLDDDDLTDLALLRLDLVAAIEVDERGRPGLVQCAHVVPPREDGALWRVLDAVPLHRLELNFEELIRELEGELAAAGRVREVGGDGERAVLVQVEFGGRSEERRLQEMLELCHSAGVTVVDVVRQRRRQPDHRFAVGKGKLEELVLHTMQLGVDLVIFGNDLTPGQARSIADACELKVIDRTQLILDIFAQHASSRDGRLQVELAQLRYRMPRLVRSSTGLSRLTGGIGGRGPGETRLEIDRRRAQDRIRLLERQLEGLRKQRAVQRKRRLRSGVPVVAIVGYTNAGKSTLLNALTGSAVRAEDRLFATLNPASRRLRWPGGGGEVVMTDTVGFIEDLPPALRAAFRATLEELEFAHVLVHVVDASDPHAREHKECVDALLQEMGLGDRPRVVVLNKCDVADPVVVRDLAAAWDGVPVCALEPASTRRLVRRLTGMVRRGQPGRSAEPPTRRDAAVRAWGA